MDDKVSALLSEMSRGVELSFRNAEELAKEAELLRKKGHQPRALVLHQISIEECGKIDIIVGHAMQLFLSGTMDLEKMASAFRSHKAKNYANAYFTEVIGDELEARKSGDVKAAVEAFKALQEKFHKDSNDAKNAALYVDFRDGKFISPGDVISAATAEAIAAMNYHFLSLTAPKVNMVENLLKDTGPMKRTLTWMKEQVTKMKDEKPKDAEAAMGDLFDQMFERFRKEVGDDKR